ncbi:hypothetical protein C5E04_18940 [Pectobacterium parmentieri]|uniref:hypothetical protein n=1 Tax=Pectobacterium parmentieri TaxID=1905730 RepID=UPI000EB05A7E|nr:hypothetical protein [Pectobacterium parmentieri]RKO74395.1 hypothetical protein C5E04_18940 [Pectobacterium parmentieri]
MNTEELKSIIAEGDYDALDLLMEHCPTVYRRFHKHSDTMAKLLNEVRRKFPDARFYTTGGDGFALLLGDSHSGESSNTELMAASASKFHVMGGDW